MAVPNFESQAWKDAVEEVKEVAEIRSKEGHEGAVEKVADESIFTERLEGAKRTATENRWRGEACLRGEHESVGALKAGFGDQLEVTSLQVCSHCRSVFVAR